MPSDSTWNEPRMDADQGETVAKFRSTSEPPLYAACEIVRRVISPKQSWELLGAVAIQCYRDVSGCSFVYFIGGASGLIKIGISKAPLERMCALQMGSPIRLRFLALVHGDVATERDYHRRFARFREYGEWFKRVPTILNEIDKLNANYRILSGEAA